MSTTQKTDDIVSSSETVFRLDQQTINDVLIHPNYEVWKDGVYLRKKFKFDVPPPTPSLEQDCPNSHKANLSQITGRPCYIFSAGHRVDDDKSMIGVRFYRGPSAESTLPSWKSLWTTQKHIADPRKIMELCDDGFPVNGNNVKALIQYLNDCYDFNTDFFRSRMIVKRSGFHRVGPSKERFGWLVGREWISEVTDVQGDGSSDDITKALRSAGTEEEWTSFARSMWEFSPDSWIVRWTLAGAFASPLLRFVGERTFALHHYGDTHGGKSTLSYLAQSVMGHPKDFCGSLTRTTAEAAAEIFNNVSDFLFLMDETQGRNDSLDLGTWIYNVTQEKHKSRSTPSGGVQAPTTKPWRLIIKTTGENPMSGEDSADTGGQENRTLEYNHPGITPAQAKLLWEFSDKPKNYGLAGPKFLRRLYQFIVHEEGVRILEKKFQQYIVYFARDVFKREGWSPTTNGKIRAVDRQLAVIALGSFLMLQWIFGFNETSAEEISLRDGKDIALNWLRVRDGDIPQWKRAIEAFVEHRAIHPTHWADLSTDEGLAKIISLGSKSAAPIMAGYNGGKDKNELWLWKTPATKLYRDRFGSSPSKVWEQLAREKILLRATDRFEKERRIGGAWKGLVIVFDQTKFFNAAEPTEEKPIVEVAIEKIELPEVENLETVLHEGGGYDPYYDEDEIDPLVYSNLHWDE